MLNKIRISLNERKRIVPTLPLIVIVHSISDYEKALILLKAHEHPLKGIELPLTLARQLDLSIRDISYLSIHIDAELEAKELSKYLQKNRFIEIFLLEKFYHCLPYCKDASRIVLETERPSIISPFFPDMVAMSKYPLIKNMPFCHVPIEHCYEFYQKNIQDDRSKKPIGCDSCLFMEKCPGPGTLMPKPIIDASKYKQALEFVNDENTAARF